MLLKKLKLLIGENDSIQSAFKKKKKKNIYIYIYISLLEWQALFVDQKVLVWIWD